MKAAVSIRSPSTDAPWAENGPGRSGRGSSQGSFVADSPRHDPPKTKDLSRAAFPTKPDEGGAPVGMIRQTGRFPDRRRGLRTVHAARPGHRVIRGLRRRTTRRPTEPAAPREGGNRSVKSRPRGQRSFCPPPARRRRPKPRDTFRETHPQRPGCRSTRYAEERLVLGTGRTTPEGRRPVARDASHRRLRVHRG